MKILKDPYEVLVVPSDVEKNKLLEFWKKNNIKIVEINGKRKRVLGIKHLKEICFREGIK